MRTANPETAARTPWPVGGLPKPQDLTRMPWQMLWENPSPLKGAPPGLPGRLRLVAIRSQHRMRCPLTQYISKIKALRALCKLLEGGKGHCGFDAQQKMDTCTLDMACLGQHAPQFVYTMSCYMLLNNGLSGGIKPWYWHLRGRLLCLPYSGFYVCRGHCGRPSLPLWGCHFLQRAVTAVWQVRMACKIVVPALLAG